MNGGYIPRNPLSWTQKRDERGHFVGDIISFDEIRAKLLGLCGSGQQQKAIGMLASLRDSLTATQYDELNTAILS